VLQLHEARNQAQHHGTVADASNMPSWAAQSQRFIDSLVAAEFRVELRSVLIADAVENEDVRLPLVEAEKALDQQDGAGAFDAAMIGFDLARSAWRGQRVESIGELRLAYSGLSALTGNDTDPTNLSLRRFDDLSEVQSFAPDIGEYHWLLARRGEVEHGLPATTEVARRAFHFVLAWVLRWEAFAVRYEARRYPPPPPSYEPPVTGSDHPSVHATTVETQHHIGNWTDVPSIDNVRYLVRVMLADVPTERRDIWAEQVGDVLNEAAADRGFDHVGAANVGTDGIIRFHGVSADVTGAEIRSWVQSSLAEGGRRYRDRLAERAAGQATIPDLVQQLAAAVESVDADGLVLRVFSTEREDGSSWIGVQLRRDEDPRFGHALDEAIHSARSGLEGVEYFDTTLWFIPRYEPASAATLVASISASYREQAGIRSQGLADVENRRRALEAELHDTSGLQGDQADSTQAEPPRSI